MQKFPVFLALAFLLVVSCNIFNPSGTTTVNTKDADALISYAEKQFQKAAYTDAADYFRKAILADSTKSEAYFGLAKSGLRAAGANPLKLLSLVSSSTSTSGTNSVPFMNEGMEMQNIYYKGMQAVDTSLKPLVNRDTLTELWEYATLVDKHSLLLDSLSDTAKKHSIEAFQTTYKHGTIYTWGASQKPFPLSDRKVKYSRFKVDYSLAEFVVLVLGFLDFNKDGSIDSKDIPIKITRDSNGNINVNVSEIMNQAATDTNVANTLNSSIDKLASGSGDITALISSMAGTLGLADTGSNAISSQTKAAIDSQLVNFGGQAKFYKLGDHKDNDGDGCLDEELFDSTDNDNDGLIDEDLRLVLPTSQPGKDGTDHDGDGTVDGANEYWPDAVQPAKDGNGKRLLPFVADFPSGPNGETNFNSSDLTLKAAVAADTLGTAYPLTKRKQLIGGCWHNYTEATFQAYLIHQRQ